MKCLAASFLMLAACATGPATPENSVIAALYPLGYLAMRIGGEAVTVQVLTPPGAEPHDVELTPGDLALVGSADLVVYLGGGFQPALEDALRERAAGSLDLMPAETRDPHIWLDPVRMIAMAERVRDTMGTVFPDDADTFAAAARFLIDDLRALDRAYRDGLAACRRRTLVVSHAAFGHLAARYGLDQHAIAGISPASEPDAARLSELADLVRREGVSTIFTETLVDPAIARTLADEAAVKTDVLDPLEGVTREAAERGEDYPSIMEKNLSRLRVALGCR